MTALDHLTSAEAHIARVRGLLRDGYPMRAAEVLRLAACELIDAAEAAMEAGTCVLAHPHPGNACSTRCYCATGRHCECVAANGGA